MIGVDNRLDRVANVVSYSLSSLRVWIAVRCCISVDDPEETTPIGNDKIRVPVKGNKRSDLRNPLLDLAVVKDPAFIGNLLGEENARGSIAG